jgi:cytochrome c oxidase cbb3-type subunit I/II
MWKTFTEEGQLKFQFLESITHILPMYVTRSLGGTLYLAGVFVMIYNVYKTVAQGNLVANEAAEAPPLPKIIVTHGKQHWHRWIERRPVQMLVFSLVAVAIGGILEIVPTFLIKNNVPTITSVKPYTPLELHGRDVYVREGCYTCHSQMIRPFRDEVARYGEYSKAGEFIYDHPFQWGSKRTGPDLARIGGKYPDSWHYNHMLDPRIMSPGSIMPSYPWLLDDKVDTSITGAKIRAMQTLGVPYPAGYHKAANADLIAQGNKIKASLKKDKLQASNTSEIVALIAYLQRVGTDIKAEPKQQTALAR